MEYFRDLPLFQVILVSITTSFIGMSVAAVIIETNQKSDFIQRWSNLKFIKNDKVNDWIGVNITKWLVTKTFWAQFNVKLRLKSTDNVERLKEIRFEMTKAEIAHLLAFVIQSIIIMVAALLDLDGALITGLTVTNLFLNLYPSLLQQRNKTRVDRLLARCA